MSQESVTSPRILVWVLLSFLTMATGGAATAYGAQKPRIQLPKITKYTLPNGLDVLLCEDHRLPTVSVQVLYHVGPVNELPGRTGFAHLFEHLMFSGSLHVKDKDYFKILDSIGAQDVNATTDLDHTQYFETVPSEHLQTALWLESDRMGFLGDAITSEKLANQRDVVRNERRQTIEGAPYGLAEEQLYHLLFPAPHPYFADVIGSHADIESAQLGDVRSFFERYYTPGNASLALVGDFSVNNARLLIDKYFGSLPSPILTPRTEVKKQVVLNEIRGTITDRVAAPRVYIAWLTDTVYSPGDAQAALLAQILGGGRASLLYRRLVVEKNLAESVEASQSSLKLSSVLTIQATAKPGVKPEQLESAIDEELAHLRQGGLDLSDLIRAQNVISARMVHGLESSGGELGVAGRISVYNHYLGQPDFLSQDLQRFQSVSVQDITKLAGRLDRNSRVVLYCVPGEKKLADVPRAAAERDIQAINPERTRFIASQQWRTERPAPGPAPSFSLPVPVLFRLANGLSVYLLERHDLPVVAMDLLLLSGSGDTPPGKPGLATFMTKALEEGTISRSAFQVAQNMDQLGSDVNLRSIADWSGLLARCIQPNCDATLKIVSDLALHPAFSTENIERVRQASAESLSQEDAVPNRTALKVFYRSLFQGDNPYAYTEAGTLPSIQAISRTDVINFWSQGYVPTKAVLALSGDMTQTEALRLANKYFGEWMGPRTTTQPLLEDGPASGRKVILVDKPGAKQTVLIIGEIGVDRASNDYVPLELLSSTLGGLTSSRLNTNLREEHGYTYGVLSQFVYRRNRGPFFIRTTVRSETTAPALTQIFAELNRIATEPISAKEVQVAKDAMTRSLPSQFDTTQQAARSIANLFIYGLPTDYYERLPAAIRNVDQESINLAAKRHIHPQLMTVVAVGDVKSWQSSVEQLQLGKVEIKQAGAGPK